MCSQVLLFTHCSLFLFFFFNDPATTEIYTLSLHDALPIFTRAARELPVMTHAFQDVDGKPHRFDPQDRKSTRLNSSHVAISYAVFCLKKKKQNKNRRMRDE